MTDDYPTAAELDAAGVSLQRDVCLWNERLAREYRATPLVIPARVRKARQRGQRIAAQPRIYASRFVGVLRIKGRWVGVTGPRSNVHGPRRLSEEEAAWDRARALGLSAPEVRP
jgi:hypothetical protein